jgi:glycosyltransferase involved in cell wall biosynthesis
MKMVLGTPTYNESYFIDAHVKNAIEVGFDEIVYLDDGSTDDTYQKLLDYQVKYKHIHVFKTPSNSVLSNTMNRWKFIAYKCRELNPDWIMVRAADEIMSFPTTLSGGDLLRVRLNELMRSNVNMVAFPVVHLWRSPWWYRSDGEWGYSALNAVSDSCWRNDSGWDFIDSYSGSGIHIGGHRPNKFRGNALIKADINNNNDFPFVVVLHYGMSGHTLLLEKLKYQWDVANAIGSRAVGVPSTYRMPHPRIWKQFNGYKIADEYELHFEKVDQRWFGIRVPDVPIPPIKSFYGLIKKYSSIMAEEYKELYKDIVIEE